MTRTRFAPSPTGSLHIGNVRIAVLNWLLARHDNGEFLLRIEDTNVERNVPGAEATIFQDLRWLGLDWDEGPAWEGRPAESRYGPFRQSERGAIYHDAAERLHAAGHAFPCFCTDAELEAMRAAALARVESFRYDGRCARLSAAERAARQAQGLKPALRFRVPEGETVLVRDAIRGEIRFATDEVSDFVLLRADGRPTYNFAVVVDDIAMAITHVVRGSGHLSNTPRQVLLYRAFGAPEPVFAHVPTVLGPDRQKLSKRHGAQALSDYRAQGYHPDALVNYLSLLSWSSPSGDEVLERDRLVREISLERMGVADVVYDPDKLRWLSARHIERMPLPALVQAVQPFLDARSRQIPNELLDDAVGAVRSHLSTFAEVNEHLASLFPPEDGAQEIALDDAGQAVVRAAATVLADVSAWQRTPLEAALRTIGERAGVRGRALYTPLRLALTGQEHGPPFWAVLEVQGREPVLERLRQAAAGGR